MDDLLYRARDVPDPEGLIVLLHGRGADGNDLFPLLEYLDRGRRCSGITPQAPLRLPPGGFHWYALGGIPTPDPQTFHSSFELLGGWLDAAVEATGLGYERLVLGGFSQGGVMSYALALARGRPRPGGLLVMSSFLPRVDGLDLDLDDVPLRVAIGHGTLDDIIGVEWGREASERLPGALYREYPLPHAVDPRFLQELSSWLARSRTRGRDEAAEDR